MDDVVSLGVELPRWTNRTLLDGAPGDLASLRAAQVALAVAEYHLRSCGGERVRRPALELAHDAEAAWHGIAQLLEYLRSIEDSATPSTPAPAPVAGW